MAAARAEQFLISEQLLDEDNWADLIKGYLLFQLKYSFFYRDILDLMVLSDQAKSLYEIEVTKVIGFNKNSMYMSIGKGYLYPEPREGIYDGIAATINDNQDVKDL